MRGRKYWSQDHYQLVYSIFAQFWTFQKFQEDFKIKSIIKDNIKEGILFGAIELSYVYRKSDQLSTAHTSCCF